MTQVPANLQDNLEETNLRYVSDASVGYKRKKVGKEFSYFDTFGKIIKDKKTIDRINALVIPPAWDNVWICPSPQGYLQATGFDQKDRKQYLYHQKWKEIAQQNKFHKMIFFGKVLPEIRSKISSDISRSATSKDKILATLVWLLEHTFIRIGNEEYAHQNQSYGLTTLRNKHVKVRGKNIHFQFKGKSGVRHTISITHPTIAKTIKHCIELPGYEIFQYVDDQDHRHVIDSQEVNLYLKKITGEEITAKDFRTWGGTNLAAVTLYKLGPFETKDYAGKNIRQAVSVVSKKLGNTIAVCRSYYIHPTVIDTYQTEILIPHFDKTFSHSKKPSRLSKEEAAVLSLLKNYS